MIGSRAAWMLNKVPQVTIYFWIVKVLATTVGETFADFLATTLRLGLFTTSYVMTGLFLVGLAVQLTTKRYVPAVYWTVVVLISVVGTLLSDMLVDKLGVGLKTSSVIFCAILVAIFAAWWLTEKSLSVHKINSGRRELFYWAAILLTFALGTSAGDLTSEAFGLGYGVALLIFAVAIAIVAIAYFVFKIDGVLAFWMAYILTRPLGASTGDLLSQARDAGGLNLGSTVTSLIFLVVIVGLVVFLSITKVDQLRASDTPP